LSSPLLDPEGRYSALLLAWRTKSEANIGLKPEDITLALGSVFQPVTSGLVKDDGVPPGIWDVVTRLKSGQP